MKLGTAMDRTKAAGDDGPGRYLDSIKRQVRHCQPKRCIRPRPAEEGEDSRPPLVLDAMCRKFETRLATQAGNSTLNSRATGAGGASAGRSRQSTSISGSDGYRDGDPHVLDIVEAGNIATTRHQLDENGRGEMYAEEGKERRPIKTRNTNATSRPHEPRINMEPLRR